MSLITIVGIANAVLGAVFISLLMRTDDAVYMWPLALTFLAAIFLSYMGSRARQSRPPRR